MPLVTGGGCLISRQTARKVETYPSILLTRWRAKIRHSRGGAVMLWCLVVDDMIAAARLPFQRSVL